MSEVSKVLRDDVVYTCTCITQETPLNDADCAERLCALFAIRNTVTYSIRFKQVRRILQYACRTVY